MSLNWTYGFKHWAFTIILAPILYTIAYKCGSKNPNEVVGLTEVLPFTLVVSILFSIPTFIIYLITFYFLNRYKSEIKTYWIKTILILLTITGICITLYAIGGKDSYRFMILYSTAAAIAGLLLKLKQINI